MDIVKSQFASIMIWIYSRKKIQNQSKFPLYSDEGVSIHQESIVLTLVK